MCEALRPSPRFPPQIVAVLQQQVSLSYSVATPATTTASVSSVETVLASSVSLTLEGSSATVQSVDVAQGAP